MTDKKEEEKKGKSKEHDSSKHVDIEPTIDEEKGVLSVSQRKARGRSFKKNRAKIKRGRERASKKKAGLDKLKKRASKKALGMIKDRLAGKKSYKSLSPAEKVAVDKRAAKVPSSRVSRLAKTLLPKVKRSEKERLEKRRTKNESFDVETLASMSEEMGINVDAMVMAEAIIVDKILSNMDGAILESFEMPMSLVAYKAVKEHDLSVTGSELLEMYKQEYIGEETLGKISKAKGKEILYLDEQAIQRWVYTTRPNKELKESSDDTYAIAKAFLEEEECKLVSKKQMTAFEKVVDKLFKSFDIDFSFTKHFADRMGDGRNDPCIDMKDLASTFKKLYAKLKKDGNTLSKHKDTEVVLKDLQQDLNLPIAVEYDRKNDELDVIMKTIMRKKNFRTPNDVVKV